MTTDQTGCDRCGHTPLVLVRKGALELVLCGHHFHDDEALLELGGWRVVWDGRPQLVAAEAARR